MNDILTYNDFSTEELFGTQTPSFEKFHGSSKGDRIVITLHTDTQKIQTFKNAVNYISVFQNKKEEYCIKAINNLIKKNNFLGLSLELSENQITDEFYENEIELFPNKYVVDINYLKDPLDLKVISEIVKKIESDLSIDEVAEIFSLDASDIENSVKQIKE